MLIFILWGFISGCVDKPQESLQNDISYAQINHTLTGPCIDTVSFSPLCGNLIFEICRKDTTGILNTLSVKLHARMADDTTCLHYFRVTYSNDITPLDENIYLPTNSFLSDPDNEYVLDHFTGQGIKYIGVAFRYKIHTEICNWAWIKVYCSSNNDTLKIIDWAYNTKSGGIIKVGQKE